MSKNYFKLSAFGTALLIWLLLIFGFSSQSAVQSNKLSRSAASAITAVESGIAESSTSKTISRLNILIRKSAHFFLYFVLGILIINILALLKFSGWEAYIQTTLLCLVYAVLDEFHQFFVPGRSPRLTDVLIDGAGCAVGLLLYLGAVKLVSGLSTDFKRHKYFMDDNTKIN